MRRVGLTAVFALLTAAAMAAPIVETWSSGGSAGWQISGTAPYTPMSSYGSLSPANPGGPAGYLNVTGGAFPVPAEDYISVSSSPFTGNYLDLVGAGPVTSISFDFYANADIAPGQTGAADLPDGLRLYFVGTSETWYYDLTPGAGWNTYTVTDLTSTSASSWYNQSVDPYNNSVFLSDLGNVSEVGIWLNYDGYLSFQEYGVDNFTLDAAIPEPSTWAALGAALTSLAMTFRGRLNATLLRFWKVARG